MADGERENWSRLEVEAVVADYLHMLTLELTGQNYNKAAHRRALVSKLNGRSEASVEMKHQNISAVLVQHGWPRILGYKPLGNFQQLLSDVIVERVKANSSIDQAAQAASEKPAIKPMVLDFEEVLVAAPDLVRSTKQALPEYKVPINPTLKRDYLEREARNASLGAAGEEFVLEFEARRLTQLGAKKLADKVEMVSRTKGDGLGYDILSFEENGRERFIEVKTTSFGKETPFFISRNEVEFSDQHLEDFHLYRVFDFRTAPRLFNLRGSVRQVCILDPVAYVGRFS